MEKGKLSVHTENILPVIKKWLYSEKEIFFRELISNALDAINKLKKISLSEEIRDPDDQDFAIDIKIDKTNSILTIEDNGIGMSRDEIQKYIAQIAFSGAEEFVKKYEESGDKSKSGIIGNFGLGFYSSFMVSKKVEIDSLSGRPGETAALWSSDGSEEYEIGEGTRKKRGTAIRLFLDDSEKEYLETAKITELVKKYCDFLPIPIRVDGKQVNREKPLWTKQPSEITRDEYNEFYRYLYPYQGDPLFYIHLNVDYPFQLQGILYFPKLAHEMDVSKNNIRIYCKQVFVTDEAQEIVPQFLTVLQGVLDLPDLPLNVSRSYIQNEPQIKKISQHIIKKVADRLNEEFKNHKADYENIWNEIGPFVKYGMLNDDKFYEQAKSSVLYEIEKSGEKNIYVTLEEYIIKNKEKTPDKIYYTTDVRSQAGPLGLITKQGIDVIVFSSMIDTHFLHFLESKNPDHKFVRVDAEISDQLVDKDAGPELADASSKDTKERITDIFKKILPDSNITIQVENFKSEEPPAIILLPEHARRFSEMTAAMNQKMPDFPADHTIVLNMKNELIRKLAKPSLVTTDGSETKAEKIARQIYYLARLSQGGISHDETARLVGDSFTFLNDSL